MIIERIIYLINILQRSVKWNKNYRKIKQKQIFIINKKADKINH